jgi:vacuolar-type H+-ATPase subunit H
MEDDVLVRVISVEKEIQTCLEAERTKAREWLEGVRKESEEEFAREAECIREESRKSAERAKNEAMTKAKIIIKEAGGRAERLLNLNDETLREMILRRLGMILPE